MKLIDFKTNRDSTFSGLRCKLMIVMKKEEPILSAEGSLSVHGIDSFDFVSKDLHYKFKFKDDSDARLILDRMRQNSDNLAFISPLNKKSDEFDLHVTFFYSSKIDIETNVIISNQVKETLWKKKLAERNPEKFEESVRQNFVLTNGRSNCYAYTIGNYALENELSEGGGGIFR